MKAQNYILMIVACSFLFACEKGAEPKLTAPEAEVSKAAPSPMKPATSAPESKKEKKKAKRKETPLPTFSGKTLDGNTASVSDMIGKRFLLFFFNPETVQGRIAGNAVSRILDERETHNFDILGVAIGTPGLQAASFAEEKGFDFPIILDGDGKIGSRFRLRNPAALLVIDADGYIVGGTTFINEDAEDPHEEATNQLKDFLRIPRENTEPNRHRMAPDFSTISLTGEEKQFQFSSLQGKPVILIFFLHTCPHCHNALKSLLDSLSKMDEKDRPVLVGISVRNTGLATVRKGLEEEGIPEFEPILVDPGRKIAEAFGNGPGVPVIYFIDREGRIQYESSGWKTNEDPALTRMAIAKISGGKVPILLPAEGYSGNDFCVVCHEKENDTWLLTKHSTAFDTLVRHGQSANPECIGCHVIGYGENGGYAIDLPKANLENVGCETCHGRGGPHLSPSHVVKHDYEAVCKTCHNPKHSVGFEYETFKPHISHIVLAASGQVPPKGPSKKMSRGDFVGSGTCISCHPAEYESWKNGPHGNQLDVLGQTSKHQDAQWLARHTTGYGKETGFPENGNPADHPALAEVGCEACHYGGSEHIKEGATRLGTILSLGDKCDSCAIMQICGDCHPDPEFEFNIQEKISLQEHGTIEPGTGRPKQPVSP